MAKATLLRPRFGLDIDGVLYKWVEAATSLLNEEFGYSLGESTHWNYIKDNVETIHWKWLWDEGVREHGLFRYGGLYKGARKAVEELGKSTHLVLITKRPPHATRDTGEWVAYNRIRVAELHVIGPQEQKSSIRPHCDIYLDDSVSVTEDLVENTNADKVLLWSRPWNHTRTSPSVQRVDSWEEVHEEVKKWLETEGFMLS